MGNHRTNASRNKRQKLKAAYGRVREEAQLQGIIPTTPEGAAKPERVNPKDQTEQQFPALVAEAARNGWATPDHIKPKIVDALIEPFLKRDVVEAPDGTMYEVPPDRYLLTKNAQVLATLDKMQHERDNPEEGGDINIDNTVNVVTWDAMRAPPQTVQLGVEDDVEKRIADAANNKQEVTDGAAQQQGKDDDVHVQGPAQEGTGRQG